MSGVQNNKLRLMLLMHEDLMPPENGGNGKDKKIQPWKTEFDVLTALKHMGHEVKEVGVYSDLSVIRKAIEEFKPHITFNLLEEFDGDAVFDQHVVSFLELMKQRYTGCNPRGLTIAHDKALTKKILAYHRIKIPHFAVFQRKRKVKRPPKLEFPLLVKSLSEDGSAGISQASVVYDDKKLIERVEFIHRTVETHAIVEEYIEGRELYVAVLGNHRLITFPTWELVIKNLPEGAQLIATDKVKWNYAYQKRVGVVTQAANLEPEVEKRIEHLSKRIYKHLSLSGYARLDYRLKENGELYLIEANPNPNISASDDFADAAKHAGVSYHELVHKIINLGLAYRPHVYD